MSYKIVDKTNINDFKHFKLSEFKCKCGGKYCSGFPVGFSYELASNLENIRNHFKKAVIITSAIRCQTWNDKQKGSVKNSYHVKGWATDFYISGVSYKSLASYVKKMPYYKYCYNICGDVIHYQITPPKESTKSKYSGTFPVLPSNGFFKKGNKGTQVKNLQLFLNWANNAKLNVDGVVGDKTIKEVKTFQKNVKIMQDGLFGKSSLSKAKTYER